MSAYDEDGFQDSPPPPYPSFIPTTCYNISSLMVYLDMTGEERQLCKKNYEFVAKLFEHLAKKADLKVIIRANVPNVPKGLKKFKFTVKTGSSSQFPHVSSLTHRCSRNNLKPSGFHNITNHAENSDAIIFIVGATSPDVMKPTLEHFINSGKPVYLVNLRENQGSHNDLLWSKISPSLVTSEDGYYGVSKQLRCP